MLTDIVSPLSFLKNPMILMAVVSMGLMFGMPKLMENSKYSPVHHQILDGIANFWISGSRDEGGIRGDAEERRSWVGYHQHCAANSELRSCILDGWQDRHKQC
jgi:hypothetical protein